MNITNPKQIGNPGKSPGMICDISKNRINFIVSALRYELMLKEVSAKCGSKEITPERISTCFEIFGQLVWTSVHVILASTDELLPQLGVFQRIMKMIRDELFTAVYSSNFTAVGHHDNKKSLQYIPHCAITKRHLDQQ